MTETVASDTTISAEPERILEVLLDFETYPEWARAVKQAKVLERDEEGRPHTVEFEVTPGPLPKMRYVLRYHYPADGIAWEYVEGDMRDVHGSYRFHPADGGTKVTYDLAIDPGKIPLPGFVKARAAREITRVALQELKRRVEG